MWPPSTHAPRSTRVFEGEPVDLGPGATGGSGGADIVGVENAVVVLVLRCKDALFGEGVVFEGAVAVEVVGRDVEDDGDGGVELLSGFKLEAGDFEDGPGGVGAFVDEGDDGDADVAADEGGEAGLLEDFAEQRRGGGFAVGAGDGEDFAFEEAGGEFEFADDGQAEVAGLRKLGRVEWDAGADDDEVLAAEGEQAVAAGFDVDALFEEGGNVFGEGFGAADVGDGDLGAAAAQKESGSQAGFAQPDDQNFFAFEFHHEDQSSGYFYRDRIVAWLWNRHGVSPVLAQFEGGEGKQRKHQGHDPEADDDFGLAPAELLEVVVQRGHLEDAFLAELVAAYLEHDGERFEDEDAADEGEQEFLADDDGDGADGAAEGERADIAHEDFGGVGVVPEKADGGADHGAAEDGELADDGHALQFEVVGEDDVAADVGEHGERAGRDDGAADGEAVEAVGEVDGVGGAHQNEDDEARQRAQRPGSRDAASCWAKCQSRSGRQLLMNGTVSCVENSLNWVRR